MGTSEDFTRWASISWGLFNNREKKRNNVAKTYPEVSDRAKNLHSVQHRSQILCDNNRLPNQLLLSSEIAPFEGSRVKNPQNPMIFLVKSLVWQHRVSMYFEGLTPFLGEAAFKWSYLGAQEELVGQMVIVT